jgi:hypothetical protein
VESAIRPYEFRLLTRAVLRRHLPHDGSVRNRDHKGADVRDLHTYGRITVESER